MDLKLLAGILDVLVLEVVSEGPSYGYQITQTVLSRSGGRFELKEGSLYPALHRLERQKLLSSNWREADGRRRKYYRLTSAGAKALEARRREWAAFAAGVNGVLGASRGLA
jgi:transcriptional regulator